MNRKLLSLLLVCMFTAGGCASAILNSQKVESEKYETSGSAIHYFLPKGFIKLRFTKQGTKYTLEYVETVCKPDGKNLFWLRYDPMSTSDDDVKIEITNEGLIDKITVTSKEKTGEIIIKIIELAKEIAKAVAPFPIPTVKLKKLVLEDEKVVKEFVLDLTDETVINELNEKYLEKKFKVELKRSFDNSLLITQEKINSFFSEKKSIYYRPLLPYKLRITNSTGENLLEQIVLLPNEAPVLGLDVTRAAFVEKFTELDFDNGTLKSIHIKKPSETLAFMDIPLNIVQGIVSVPAEIIQIKINYSSRNKELIEAYKAELEAREELEKLLEKLKEQRNNSSTD